ncbi:hypothetical protein NMY22_g7412 [Coprinellus aureogranulatus]|nr:hypothetical protein NMY22_g7412 [Coprinellus aureogranulatus]
MVGQGSTEERGEWLGVGRRSQGERKGRKRRGDEMDVDDEGEGAVKAAGRKEHGKYLERPIRPLPARKVSPAVPGERHRGDLTKQVEQLFDDQAMTSGRLTDLESQLLVLRRQHDESQTAYHARIDGLQKQGYATDEAHARRLDALETKAASIDDGTLQSLMTRFGQLEAKVDIVESQVLQHSGTRQNESGDDISGLAAMGGWQGVVEHLKAEIKSVIETHDPNLTLQRVQSEIVQRFDSLSQILQAQQQEQEKRNLAQLRGMLDGLVQRLSVISGNSGGPLEPGSFNQAFEQVISSTAEGFGYSSHTSNATSAFQASSGYGVQNLSGSSLGYATEFMNTGIPHAQHSGPPSVATLPPLSTDSYAMSHSGARASLPGRLRGGDRGMTQGHVPPQAHSYQGTTTSLISASSYGAQTLIGPGPSDSISQRHSIGRGQQGYDFGHTHHLAPPAEISIRSAATDGSASSSTARDGGVPHPERLNWPGDRSILTSVATSAGGNPENVKGKQREASVRK